jgi:hypothetical protein
MRSLRILVAAALVMVVAMPAAAAPPETLTTVEHLTETYTGAAFWACEVEGPLYEITLTYKSVVRETEFGDGFRAVYAQTGEFVAEPLDASLPGASGRYNIKQVFKERSTSFFSHTTKNAIGRLDDGTKIDFHLVDHIEVTPAGEVSYSRCRD